MAVTERAPAGPAMRPADGQAVRAVTAWHFVRLKLRVMANGFRGQGWRVALFVLGILGGLWLAGTGFVLLAMPGLAGNPELAGITAALGGTLLVLGWVLLPLVFFGVDETLDPSRFALLPLTRRQLVTGLFAAALVGIPAVATLLGTTGLVVTAWRFGGPPAGLVALLGVVAGLLLCVAGSRAVTSAFATMLRSRRMRDLAAILLAVCAAMIGPLQIALIGATERIDLDRLAGVAGTLGWTPLAAPYTLGVDMIEGRAWAVPVKLLIIAVTFGALLLWWSRSLESAMTGAAGGAVGPARADAAGSPVAKLFPRVAGWLPRDRYGALVAREIRYWWRDARRRANLITFAVISIFIPVIVNLGGGGFGAGVEMSFNSSMTLASLSMLFVGVLAAVTLANQFGFDGSAYATNVIIGVPGRLELRSRIVAFSIYIVPLMVVAVAILAALLREPTWIGPIVGAMFAGYGVGLAINLFASVLAAYSLPETSNPFAINSGAGMAKSLLTLVAMIASTAVAAPMVVATALLGDLWLWLALPVGVGYGVGAALLGCYLAGDVLDHRMPELVTTVTPRC